MREFESDEFQGRRRDIGLGEAFSEAFYALKDMVQSERNLLQEEAKHTTSQVTRYAKQIGIFAGLAILSIPPFIAFIVIGLGRLLENNYWLSALIVGLTFSIIGVLMVRHAMQKLKSVKMMPHSKRSLDRTRHIMMDKFSDIRGTASRRFEKLQKEARRGVA